MTIPNKDHWYDGWFYDTVIAPNQDRMFKQIRGLIAPNSSVIDIGCGTGRFPLMIAGHCSSVLGIDISRRNIDRANKSLVQIHKTNVTFRHTDTAGIAAESAGRYHYAVLTYVLHEINEEDRVLLLQHVSTIADAIIIGDYLVPKPAGFWSGLNEIVEFVAGKEHYANFKHFVANGGVMVLAEQAGLSVIREIKNMPATSHIVLLASTSTFKNHPTGV